MLSIRKSHKLSQEIPWKRVAWNSKSYSYKAKINNAPRIAHPKAPSSPMPRWSNSVDPGVDLNQFNPIPIVATLGLGPGVYVVPSYGSWVPSGESAFASVFVGLSFPAGKPHVNPMSAKDDEGYHTCCQLPQKHGVRPGAFHWRW